MKHSLLFILLIFFVNFQMYSQVQHHYIDELNASIHPSERIPYKNIDNQEFKLHILAPEGEDDNILRPCVIGIHGGGWTGGDPTKAYAIIQEYVKRGWVGISIEYRLLENSKGYTVFDCVKDTKSAIRYIKEHSAELGIDSSKITLGGLSAGGHLALGALLFDTVNEASDNLAISTRPQYLILYYPVVDTSTKGYGNMKIGNEWLKLSPLHNIKANMPPVLIFHGMKDDVVPIEGIINFQKKMVSIGNTCDLILHGDGIHGYFLYSKSEYNEVINQTFSFLKRLEEAQ